MAARAKDRELRWTVLGAALDLRGCGPWRQGWEKVGSTRTIESPESRQAGRGAPRGNQRRRCEAGTSRGALSGGGGHWRNAALAAAAGGVRSDSEPHAAAPPRTPPSAAGGQARAKTRSADAFAGSRPLGAST